MLFNNFIKEDADISTDDVAGLNGIDPSSDSDLELVAAEIEDNMQSKQLEAATFMEGGTSFLNEFFKSEEFKVLTESRKMPKATFVRLSKVDDLMRRAHMGSLIIAREKGDILFKKLKINRINERRLREAIFKKYGRQATIAAKKSQTEHIKKMRTMPADSMMGKFGMR